MRVKNECNVRATGFNAANALVENKNDIRFAKHFEPGHLSCLNFGSLKFSLDFLSRIGKDKIEEHNKALAVKAKNEFTALGLLSSATSIRKEHSTIFNIKGDANLFQHLAENDVICAERGGGIRMGFHFYNTENDIDAIVRILKEAL